MDEGFQLNERKCKEHKISFARNEPEFDPIWVNRQTLETVNSVKLLGLNISSDLKWNVHMSELVRKVSTRLYFLRQLKKSHVATRELLLFYITCIRSILEYGSPVFHRALPSYLSEDLERLQRRATKIIYPELSYAKALELSGLLTLYDRREANAAQLFDEIYVLINLTVSTNYFQINTSQATLWDNKEHLFVHSVKLEDARIVFF